MHGELLIAIGKSYQLLNTASAQFVVGLLRAVLFDFGETLVHQSRPWDEIFQDDLQSIYLYLTRSGLNTNFQRFTKTFVDAYGKASTKANQYKVEVPVQDIISEVLQELDFKSTRSIIQEAMIELHKPEIEAWQLFPDTIKTLVALRDNGLKLGLISNSKSDWMIRAVLEKFDLKKFFDVVLTSAVLQIRKPRPEIFMHALKSLDIKPSEAVFVGDNFEADVLGARMIGMRSIHLTRKRIEIRSIPDSEVAARDLSEALSWIIKWNNDRSKSPQ